MVQQPLLIRHLRVEKLTRRKQRLFDGADRTYKLNTQLSALKSRMGCVRNSICSALEKKNVNLHHRMVANPVLFWYRITTVLGLRTFWDPRLTRTSPGLRKRRSAPNRSTILLDLGIAESFGVRHDHRK
jgi:hypothetical protein